MVETTILALKRPLQTVGLGPSHQYRFVNGSDDSIRLSFANIETKLQSALRVALAKEKMFAA